MLKFQFIVLFTILSFSITVFQKETVAAGTQITLAWSPNSEPDLAGYRIYARPEEEDYDYENPAWEGPETTCTLAIGDETSQWCFVARAFDTEGFESADSDEACTEDIPSSFKSSYPYNGTAEPIGDDNGSSGGCFLYTLTK